MRISIARRGKKLWSECAELASERYSRDFQANISPAPDAFIALTDGGTENALLACAGLTFGGSSPLFIEGYFGNTAAETISRSTQVNCEPADLVEVGPLATRQSGAGLALVKLVPALCWCNGASFIVCTATLPLRKMLDRLGIQFIGVTDAKEENLSLERRGSWGSYYRATPVAGYIDLRRFDVDINRPTASPAHLTVAWEPGNGATTPELTRL